MIEEINDASSNLSKTSKSDDPVSSTSRLKKEIGLIHFLSSFLK